MLSDTIPTLKDPRIGFVTVTGVEAATGFAHATVYVSVFGTEEQRERTLEGLRAAHGVLQAQVGRELRLRRTRSCRSNTIRRSSRASGSEDDRRARACARFPR